MKKTFFVYKLTTPSGKVYIGQTYNINKRFSSYRNLICKKQKLLYNSIVKYGWENIKKEILFDGVVSQDKVNEIEEQYIYIYKKKKISLNILEKAGMPSYRFGKKHHASKIVLKINEKGFVLNEYESITEASNKNNVTQGCISKACITKNLKSKGFFWRFKYDFNQKTFKKEISVPHKNSLCILQVSLTGDVIKEWPSQSIASKYLKLNQGNIWKALRDENKTCGGFKWCYKQIKL